MAGPPEKTIGAAASSTPAEKKTEINIHMEGVLQLLNQRVEGQISTTQVESAVSNLLAVMGARPTRNSNRNSNNNNDDDDRQRVNATGAARGPQSRPDQPSSSIRGDTGNYDDSSDEEEEKKSQPTARSSPPDRHEPRTKKRRLDETDRKYPSSKPPRTVPPGFATDEDYRDAISEIPMGKESAKMMTTFGDGPCPLPAPLEAALMGTRKALQVSIMDARKVRRRLQKEFRDAQAMLVSKYNARYRAGDKSNPTRAAAAAWTAEQQQLEQQAAAAAAAASIDETNGNLSTPTERATPNKRNYYSEAEADQTGGSINPSNSKKEPPSSNNNNTASNPPPTTANSIDPKLVYRALAEGTDKLSYAHKCGFHIEELTHLYPEEMRAYQKWNELHEEYSESKADNGNDGTADSSAAEKEKQDNNNEPDGGHLRERAANFDYRTDQMKNDWYVEYAKVRQGSFLPGSQRVRRSQTEKEWDRLRKAKKGRHAMGEWENISSKAVRFLHWLGFDPPNLYPPDEETTQALAFLAYDRLGRIVEKAIFLRNELDENFRSLCELPQGEQLSVEDIERALNDPDIKPATVYGTEDAETSSSIQLYFGPGWEDRLELEMEEMVALAKGNQDRLSEEEKMVRKHEMELLAKISAPPQRGGDQLKELVKKHKESIAKASAEKED